MDLKATAASILPSTIKVKETSTAHRLIKSESTAEREGNGQQAFGDPNKQEHGPMSDDELKKSMEHLRQLKFVKDNGLQVQLLVMGEKKFVIIQEISGKVIRRIPESELWTLIKVTDSEKGQLINSKI